MLIGEEGTKGNLETDIELAPGKYEYKYSADGFRVLDMQCTEMAANSFGAANCVVHVSPIVSAMM